MDYFTIGMAGHIDHGKTTLTKALTGVETDRLKEEQERRISIELGFAPFIDEDDLEVSIIDVPGHESFIRQMIAGVAGVDFVILVIAADEGIMPQTREHLEILSLLGIDQGVVVLTKMDQSDEELLEIILMDIQETLDGTFLQDAQMFFVDSLSNEGIPPLKHALTERLKQMTKEPSRAPFRLPIDHVFTIKGQGVIVRGTVYDGYINVGDTVKVLPSNQDARIRHIQRHSNEVPIASSGQRAAINLGGISYDEISRGDVLVVDDFYTVSDRIDIVFHPLHAIKHLIKQRQSIKLHIGTTEVMGKIIFFDRNEIQMNASGEILCQLELEEKIVVARDDRFIVRRPSPTETIGGGGVIDPHTHKHRFGQQTIEALRTKQAGTPEERTISFIKDTSIATKSDILKFAAMTDVEFEELEEKLRPIGKNLFTIDSVYEQVQQQLLTQLTTFHTKWPMRVGMNKAEIVSVASALYPVSIVEHAITFLQEEKQVIINKQFVQNIDFTPHLPPTWEKKLNAVERELINQAIEVEKWDDFIYGKKIREELQTEFYYYLLHTGRALVFDTDRIVSSKATTTILETLRRETKGESFTLQSAREILQLSRKNLVPFLELLDELGHTTRDGNERNWQ